MVDWPVLLFMHQFLTVSVIETFNMFYYLVGLFPWYYSSFQSFPECFCFFIFFTWTLESARLTKKKETLVFYWDHIKFRNVLRENWHLYDVESSWPKAWSFHFFKSSFVFFRIISTFSAQVLLQYLTFL
jgi:hypothetical protein